MAKVQFNCRLDQSFIDWIDSEAAQQSKKLNRKFSQADVIIMLIGSAIHSDKVASTEIRRAEHRIAKASKFAKKSFEPFLKPSVKK